MRVRIIFIYEVNSKQVFSIQYLLIILFIKLFKKNDTQEIRALG